VLRPCAVAPAAWHLPLSCTCAAFPLDLGPRRARIGPAIYTHSKTFEKFKASLSKLLGKYDLSGDSGEREIKVRPALRARPPKAALLIEPQVTSCGPRDSSLLA
jgi:hypothetical protein